MFRKKEPEPVRPAEPSLTRPPSEVKPDLPRRQPETAVAAAAAEHPASSPGTTTDGKRLIVGQGISLSGEITACDRLVVEGSVQVTLNQTRAIEITETGRFTNGKAEVEEAEISGVYEGDLTVRNRLLIRSTGRVTGNVRYGEIEIERGGRISGNVSMLEDAAGRSTGSASGS
jgi:cytoskeletal protein CcmA (bactofilin family)